jgi:hypothetical protein
MKTPKTLLACLILVASLVTQASAGLIYLTNDLGYPKFFQVVHQKEILLTAWLQPNQTVSVRIDETRPKRPMLLVASLTGGGNSWSWGSDAYFLPKKKQDTFFKLSWFARSRR